ncbi:hypothetical protein NC651_039068 [Populus alba x Populus x berolinensis]|nr:hypothetical protein NC651_039068 [Populus alba x Populus x berolinensis]
MPLNITKPPTSRPHHCRISFFSYFFQGLKEKRSLELIVRCCAVFNDDRRSGGVVVGGEFCFKEETNLTAHRTCVLPGRWKIISRFDSYGPDSEPKDELVILMDATGNGLLTLHRKQTVGFAMGLVLVHDQMYSDRADDYLHDVDPTSEEFPS